MHCNSANFGAFSNISRKYHIVFLGTDAFALETLQSIHKNCIRPGNSEDSLFVITPPDALHMRKKVVHPVKQYAIENGIFFAEIPDEKRWPKSLNDLKALVGSSQKVEQWSGVHAAMESNTNEQWSNVQESANKQVPTIGTFAQTPKNGTSAHDSAGSFENSSDRFRESSLGTVFRNIQPNFKMN